MRIVPKTICLLLAAVMLAAVSACVNIEPRIDPSVTPEPTAVPTHEAVISPAPTETASGTQPSETEDIGEASDLLGNIISGPDHYARYLRFENIVIYEEDEDTFLDGVIVNGYGLPITCAVDIIYEDEDGTEIARSRLQTRDGSYLLVLQPGDNIVFARILTDMTLTDREYRFEYDKEAGIRPLNSDD